MGRKGLSTLCFRLEPVEIWIDRHFRCVVQIDDLLVVEHEIRS